VADRHGVAAEALVDLVHGVAEREAAGFGCGVEGGGAVEQGELHGVGIDEVGEGDADLEVALGREFAAKARPEGFEGEQERHIVHDQVPAMGSILLARETPPTGGDTLFASLGAAYDALSDDLKSRIENLRAVHSADHVYSADGVYAKTDLAGDLKGHDIQTMAVHPVVIRHPVTGRKILYVNPAFTLHFEGWTQADSMPLLYELYTVALRKEFQCRLSWAPGSIAIWDNRSTWHFANNDYQGHRRLMHRIAISGVPIGA
jgi:hypothetical protein